MKAIQKVGFIGIGVMGKAMAANLMRAGYQVSVYNRTKAKAQELVDQGARWCSSAGECARDQDAVITIVGYPKDVEEVYFSPGAILDSAGAGSYLIDMTTTSPELSRKIYEAARERGMFALDAPVSGGDVGAKNATLSVMVGGDREAFEACRELLGVMGSSVLYEGAAGSGQHTKMANQIALGGAIAGVCEAITYAKAVGLDVRTMLDTISKGAAGSWQMSNMAPRMLAGDFAPGFFVKHYIKDMKIAEEEAQAVDLHLGVLSQVLAMYEELEKQGMGDLGTQALIRYYTRL